MQLCGIGFCRIVQHPLFKALHIQHLHFHNDPPAVRQQGFHIHIGVFHALNQRNLIRVNNGQIGDFGFIGKNNHRIQKAEENFL